MTPFSSIYDSFLSKITDDMYMELTEFETYELLYELLLSAINKFEFPRVDLYNYVAEAPIEESVYCGVESDGRIAKIIIYSGGHFEETLTLEEINILSTYMIVEWIGQQLASVENVRMKYSGSNPVRFIW